MPDSQFSNVITPDYAKRRDALAERFAAAHRFLIALEKLHASDRRHHLGTAQNLHVYVSDRFLCYVRIKSAEKAPVLIVSPEPHQGRVKDGTQVIHAPAFVKSVEKLIGNHHGYGKWGNKKGIQYELDARTPDAFFDEFVDLVRKAAAAE